MDLVLWTITKCGPGGEGVKHFEHFADVLYVWSLRKGEGRWVLRTDIMTILLLVVGGPTKPFHFSE